MTPSVPLRWRVGVIQEDAEADTLLGDPTKNLKLIMNAGEVRIDTRT